jgi:hypothetical protein
MPEPIDIEKVVAENPAVDLSKMQEAFTALRILREQGLIQRSEYSLALPFNRRSATQRQTHRRGRSR